MDDFFAKSIAEIPKMCYTFIMYFRLKEAERRMSDNVNISKIIAILAAGAVSAGIASYFTESYAAESAAREKTLAEAVMQNQLKAELERAEEQAKKELEEQGQTLITEILETKPAATEPPVAETEPITETTSETAAFTETTTITEASETAKTETEETVPEEEEIITEFTRGGLLPEDRTGVPIKSMFTLTAEEQENVTDFLIDHYFLDGCKYSREETRPELKEKKQLAAEMESGVIETLNLLLDSVNISDISAVLSADYGALKKQVEDIRDDFTEQYSNAADYGESFAALYDGGVKYFDRLIKALGKMEETARQYNEATNPLLALGLLTSSLDGVLIPEIMAVLEQSFDLVEASQEIFLEGTQGTVLLTRGEVTDIISNPGIVLSLID